MRHGLSCHSAFTIIVSLSCLLQVMGLHLPEAPPPDSDEEEDPEGAAAQRSRAAIPMDAGSTSLWAPIHFDPTTAYSHF